MKTILTVILTILCLGISKSAISQDFYDVSTINTIEITFAESNWDYLLDQLYAAGNEDRLVGTALINGTQFDSVGVRYKGNSTYQPNQIKNPLNIKLDHIIDDQTMDGYGTLKLANVYKDPSFVREVLSYEIARQYMPASKANYIKVYINNSYIGLYTSVQSVDKFFLGNEFNSNENAFFKGELVNDSPTTSVKVWGYLGADSSNYTNFYELKSDAGWHDLIGFLDTLNNDVANVEDVLNVDRHLWMLAFDILTVNLDGPINFGHNYYLYKDDAGQFNPLIWDLNENFGGFNMLLGQGGGTPPLSTTGMQQLDPFLNLTNANYPIINKILSNSEYKKMYVAHVKTIMDEIFSSNWYQTRALEIQNIIDAEVQGDPNKFYTYSNFLNNVNNTVGGGGPPGPGNQAVVGITELMAGRLSFLNTQPEFSAAAPAISNISNTPSVVPPNSQVWFTAEVNNASKVVLSHRNSISSGFEKTEMFDDGNHNDGAAGDGIYGISVNSGASEMQYYIYAENNDAAKFSPARAAYEFYTLPIESGDLVINEFMADNDNVVADPDGEYEDWIELYNNGSSAISLFGFYLSDDGTDLTQWAFPDTSIAANGYLTIWADDDLNQAGLHANFKLSKSGEAIYLVASDTSIVDEITFGAQTTDLSTGRYPNGTGNFIEMSPTFGAENVSGVIGIEHSNEFQPQGFELQQNYPNPFNPTTTIGFAIQTAGRVELTIYNLSGQLVNTLLNENISAGNYQVQWDGRNHNGRQVANGVYLYCLKSGTFTQTKKMVFLK